MSNDKQKLVPRLRFPEFEGTEEWRLRPLSDLLQESRTRNRDGLYGPEQVLSVSGEYGCINQIELLGRSYAGVSVAEYHVVEPGNVVYTKSPLKRNPFGIIKANKGSPGIVSTLYAVYRTTGDCFAEFIDWYFAYDHRLNSYLQPIVRKGAKNDMKVNNSDVLTGPICAPSIPEQKKIAACLSSLDDLITAEGQKLDALKTHKKGLMQQLFPREGETVPRLRFPEFRGAGDWSKVALGTILEEYRESSTKQDEYEVLTSSRQGLIRQRDYYDNDRITERDNVGFNVIPPGYLTYRSRSDDRRFYFNENALGVTGIISTYYPVFRVKSGNNKFLIELLTQNADHVGKHSVGTSQTVLSINELRRIDLPMPTPPEQSRIADFLTSLDEDITAQARKFDALKAHKKGLMQGLFPVKPEDSP